MSSRDERAFKYDERNRLPTDEGEVNQNRLWIPSVLIKLVPHMSVVIGPVTFIEVIVYGLSKYYAIPPSIRDKLSQIYSNRARYTLQ